MLSNATLCLSVSLGKYEVVDIYVTLFDERELINKCNNLINLGILAYRVLFH